MSTPIHEPPIPFVPAVAAATESEPIFWLTVAAHTRAAATEHVHRNLRVVSSAPSARYGVPCAKCGAEADQPCRTLTTSRVTDTHKARIEAQG